MNEAYTKLMLKQHTSNDAAFYEKLDQAQPKTRIKPMVQAAIIAICAILLIPASVWAAETIFGSSRITIQEGTDCYGKDAVVFHTDVENVEPIPITNFSQYLQELKAYETVNFASWEEAEEAIGIDLLDNTVLTAEDTYPYAGKNPKSAPFTGVYYVYDEQLFSVKFNSVYYRERVQFIVNIYMTTDHPQMTEEFFLVYHGFGERYYSPKNTEGVSVEHFVTKNGIPVTIYFPVHTEKSKIDYVEPSAYFCVNNVSYHIDIGRWGTSPNEETPEEANERLYNLLVEVLEGFTLE